MENPANDWRAEAAARKAAIATALESLKLTVAARFVPFSQSRNKAEKSPSLNWVVTVKRDGRDVLTTNYGAGMAHCPSYNKKPPAAWDRPARFWQSLAGAAECENGHALQTYTSWSGFRHDKEKPILPDPVDVFYSLISDSSVLDHGGFEQWAAEYGYDADSRSAESIYRACLEIALKMRAAISASGMAELQTAFQDY